VDATGAPYNVSCSGHSQPQYHASRLCELRYRHWDSVRDFPGGLPDSSAGSVPQVTYIPGSVRLSGNDTGLWHSDY